MVANVRTESATADRGYAAPAQEPGRPCPPVSEPESLRLERLRALPTAEARRITPDLLRRLRSLDRESAEYSRIRAALVAANTSLVRHVARRYRSRDNFEDVMQTGIVGLIKAIDAFDPARGNQFASFAIPTISGEIKRFFRDTAWAVHVPRDDQERYLAVLRTADDLHHRLGHEPGDTEIAAELHTTADDVRRARGVDRAHAVESLDATAGGAADATPAPLGERLGGDEPALELVECRVSLVPLIHELDTREQTILKLRFWDDLTQRQIGERLGISQMQVSRLLRGICGRLREHLESDSARPPLDTAV